MTQPGIVVRVQTLLDQHRESRSCQPLEQLEVSAEAPDGIVRGGFLYIIDDLERVNVLIILFKAGPQVGTRFILGALPAPLRQDHGQAGRSTIIELLVLVADPADRSAFRQRCEGQGRHRRGCGGFSLARYPCLRRELSHGSQSSMDDGVHLLLRDEHRLLRRVDPAPDLDAHIVHPPGKPVVDRRKVIYQTY